MKFTMLIAFRCNLAYLDYLMKFCVIYDHFYNINNEMKHEYRYE